MYEEKNGLNREREIGKSFFIQKRMKNCLLFGLVNGRREEEEKKRVESVVIIFFGSFVCFSAPFAFRASCALHVVI
jgi:hypothetical protein